MLTSKVDSKRRIRIPKEVAEAMGVREGDTVRWSIIGDCVAAVTVEKEGEAEDALRFLENLASMSIRRTGEPDYSEFSKSELWMGED